MPSNNIMIVSIKRIFRSGWLGFSRNGWSNAATIFIMATTIFFLSSLFMLKDMSQFVVSSLQEKADISVYFKEASTEQDILNVKQEISEISEMSKLEYISKEQALKIFTERHENDLILMESLEELGVNPFLASLSIRAFQASQYEAISNFLTENSKFKNVIEKVDYHQRKPIIEKIFSISSFINKTGIIFSLILIIIAVLISFNTIRLAIVSNKQEISLMRLVGASNSFIRGPFLVQGAISGLFASLISIVIFSIACYALSPRIEVLFSDLNVFKYFLNSFWSLFLIQLCVGISLGVFSSFIATRKYLKI